MKNTGQSDLNFGKVTLGAHMLTCRQYKSSDLMCTNKDCPHMIPPLLVDDDTQQAIHDYIGSMIFMPNEPKVT